VRVLLGQGLGKLGFCAMFSHPHLGEAVTGQTVRMPQKNWCSLLTGAPGEPCTWGNSQEKQEMEAARIQTPGLDRPGFRFLFRNTKLSLCDVRQIACLLGPCFPICKMGTS
jgi:hypothetical protein